MWTGGDSDVHLLYRNKWTDLCHRYTNRITDNLFSYRTSRSSSSHTGLSALPAPVELKSTLFRGVLGDPINVDAGLFTPGLWMDG